LMSYRMMTRSVAVHVVKTVSQVVVHVPRVLKAKLMLEHLVLQPQLPSGCALRSRKALPRLRKQENNHAATSTQKIS
jgi:hypothetical protein